MKKQDLKRREFLKAGATSAVVGVGAAATLLTGTGQRALTAVGKGLYTPAIAQQRIEFTMVTTWPRDFPGLGYGPDRICKRLNAMSDGRIQAEYFAAGERVGAFDSFEEVSSGNAQAYHAADYYWKGKHPGWAFFTSVPFGLTYTEINAWIRFGGGQELWDELGDEFGLKNLMAGNTGVQMGGWFNKEINSPSDFRGLKMRIPGLGGDVISELGASSVSLPGGQIYENLVSGAIDATEWVGPWNDKFLKFYEATRYYYFPGMHEPGAMLAMGMNADFWHSLDEADQQMIDAAASAENEIMMSEYNAKNGASLLELVEDYGVELREFNDDVYDAFGEASEDVFAGVRAHSSMARRIYASFAKAREEIGSWTNISDQAYVAQRNRVLGV